MAPKIEICVDNCESIQNAYNGGARRIELCSSLMEGGLTPSIGSLKYAQSIGLDLQIFPMIRPRGGDFCYSPQDLKTMAMDIEALKQAGADGFVFGCLRPDGSIDIESNKTLLNLAHPLPCTFHRAFDMTANMEQSLEDVISLGFKRILTSGRAKTAMEGIEQIEKLTKLAQDRLIVMPGSGINSDNLREILQRTKAKEFHCSASTKRPSSMVYRNETVNMGNDQNGSDFVWKVSDSEKIKKLIQIAEDF